MKLVLNRPLANTYGWLRANGTAVETEVTAPVTLWEELPDGVSVRQASDPDASGLRSGVGMDTEKLLTRSEMREYRVEAGRQTSGVLRLHFSFDRADAGARIRFVLDEGSSLTVTMDYTGGIGASAVRTEAYLGRGAQLRLSQIQRTESDTFINDVASICEERAEFSLCRLILGGRDTYDGCSVELSGNESAFSGEIGYRLSAGAKLDMNYEAVHKGKKTVSGMNVAGVLSDRAFKLFRGTIDLRQGCAGAVGNELENVLMMDDTAHDQTIPVILCGEEDVVGNHGATIGRLDEELLFYLESRGIERERIYEMMAHARIDAVIRKIPVEWAVSLLLPESEDAE